MARWLNPMPDRIIPQDLKDMFQIEIHMRANKAMRLRFFHERRSAHILASCTAGGRHLAGTGLPFAQSKNEGHLVSRALVWQQARVGTGLEASNAGARVRSMAPGVTTEQL